LKTRHAVCGDLLEEYSLRHARQGRGRAEWWLASEMRSVRHAYREARPRVRPAERLRLLPPLQDWRHTLRSLRRAPWYLAATTAAIALGVGVASTVFAIVDGTLFKPLPYPQTDRLFAITNGWTTVHEPLRMLPISPAELHEWAAAVPPGSVSAFYTARFATVGVHDYVASAEVDRNFFDVIGVHPVVGGFQDEDFSVDARVPPAIVSDGFWRQRLGATQSAIGRVLVDDAGQGIRIVGVMPEGFVFPRGFGKTRAPQVLTPRVIESPPSRGRGLMAIVRLPPGMSEREFSDRLSAAGARAATAWPPPAATLTALARSRSRPYDLAGLQPLRAALMGDNTQYAWLVFIAATVLLLLACLNVSSLAIARVQDRRRGLLLRRALGASSFDLLRVLALENLMVVAIGVATGVAAAAIAMPLTTRFLTGFMVVIKPPAIDVRVAAFAALAALVCTALVTLAAARAVSGIRSHRLPAPRLALRGLRTGLTTVTAEVALALIVTLGGALAATSLGRVWKEDPGFEVTRTAILGLSAPTGAPAGAIEDLIRSLATLPGVVAVGGVGHPVLGHSFNGSEFDSPAGVPATPRGEFPIESIPITHGFLDAAGLGLLEGRLPTDGEFNAGAPVIVVSRSVAAAYWPHAVAIGRTLLNKARAFAVIGVVPDARYLALDEAGHGEIYWPIAATSRPYISSLFMRFRDPNDMKFGELAPQILQRCPTCWLQSAQRLSDAMGMSIQRRQFDAWLFSSFAIAALTIVGVGVLGLVAMSTARRTREIGIRMALGATPAGVVRQILEEQIVQVVNGLIIGCTIGALAVRTLATNLYKTPVYDPFAWMAAIGILVAIATTAALIPSRRASRVDPVQALRIE
jgi:putative ABC transport system permease protein